jgi:hypothetical protein
MRAIEEVSAKDLRLQVAHLRQQLTETTVAYREAIARHDAQQAIPLLRSRSQLMRQLLNAQCELLLSLRAQPEALDPTRIPAQAA